MTDKIKYTAKDLYTTTSTKAQLEHNRKVYSYLHKTPWMKLLNHFLDPKNPLDMDTLIIGVNNVHPRRLKVILKQYVQKGYVLPIVGTVEDGVRMGMVIILLHNRMKEREKMELHSKNYLDPELESANNFARCAQNDR